ncbi:MAG TPA: NAD(P)-dependent oxidoreductase [Propylenella sp.]
MRVGIAGLGKMGQVFTDRIIAAGHRLSVWNRDAAKTRDAAARGAKAASSLTELAANSDIVVTMVSDDAAVKEVYEGKGGLLSGDVNGKLFIDMSTVRPATHVDLAQKVEAAGARFVECPVGGSVAVARDGRLLGFAGGDAADVDRAREVLAHLCRRIDHAGPMGAGAALKLAINLPLLVYWQALGEAVSICEGFGFDPDFLMEVFSESSGGPNVLKVRGPNIARALRGEEVPVSADVRTMRKDLGLMLEEAKAKGNMSPLVEQVFASFGRAVEAGLAGLDCSAFPAYWAKTGNKRRA